MSELIFVPARQCPKQVVIPTCEGDNEAGTEISPSKPGSDNSCYPKEEILTMLYRAEAKFALAGELN